MKLELKRFRPSPTYMIGKLYIDGAYFCDTLEDIPREIKKLHETCIPVGTYKVILNMSNRFQKIMPLLLDVPNFEGIRIHAGNNSLHTSGCILVGENKIVGQLINSREIFGRLMKILQESKDEISISVI